MLSAGVLCMVAALSCLCGLFWPWYPEDRAARFLYDGLRLSLGMILCGAVLFTGYTLAAGAVQTQRKLAGTVRWQSRGSAGQPRSRREDDDSSPPESAGRPAPLQPRPGHHLAAARSLPPGDAVYLLPKD